MAKLKLKINDFGNRGAAGIEKKIKKIAGVTLPKINRETGKTVVIFDENVISSADLENKLRGKYNIEPPGNEARQSPDAARAGQKDYSLLAGIMTGLALMSILLNIYLIFY